MKSAQLLLSGWHISMGLPLPPTALAPLVQEAETALKPATNDEIAVLLEELFRVLPYPGIEAVPAWFAIARPYPARVIGRGCMALIGCHKLRTPPLPAALKEQCGSDSEYIAWDEYRRRLGMAVCKLERVSRR